MKDIERLVGLLTDAGMTVSAAESCTGGMIASAIVGFPGASAVFAGGLVSYATRIKTELLGVPAKLVEQYGVVSREVAREMAEHCRVLFKTDTAVSVTGLAGPSGGSAGIPVGRVFIGIALPDSVSVFCETFPGDRNAVREAAAETAMRHLCEQLEKSITSSR